MSIFRKLLRKLSNDKDSYWDLKKYGITNLSLDKNEKELLNLISQFIAVELIINKDKINNNISVRFVSIIYLLGVIDAFCQTFNFSNPSFYKICIYTLIYNAKNSGIKIYENAKYFLDNYNSILKYDFINKVMKIGGEDVFADLKCVKTVGKSSPISHLNSLITEWESKTFNDLTLEELEYLRFMSNTK